MASSVQASTSPASLPALGALVLMALGFSNVYKPSYIYLYQRNAYQDNAMRSSYLVL